MATQANQMTERKSSAGAPPSSRAAETAIRLPVDIFEDGEGITLSADMPGVSKERLDVRVDGDNLLIEGKVEFDLPGHAEAVYADVRSSVYRRSFVLSRELESENIHASLSDGVLRVRIPKRPALRPRKIQVQGG